MNDVAIDLYSGCGGMSSGAEAAIPGLEVRWALDIDRNATATFRKAHPEAVVDCCDVSQVSASDVIERTGIDKIDWFFAGPTCQAVSTMGVFHLEDPRNALFVHFIRLLDGFTAAGRRPKRVVMENVPGVVYGRNLVIVRELFKLFEDRGYHVFADVVNMADYGLPQLRNRFFLVATTDPIEATFPRPTHAPAGGGGLLPFVTVSEAIGDLPSAALSSDGRATVERSSSPTAFQSFVSDSESVDGHWTAGLTELNRKRIASVPQGGCWKDIPQELLPERFRKVRLTDYATLYGRLHEASPAYTISAGFANVTSGCFTHPREHRALTVREGARLQGFKDSFSFCGPRGAQYRQVGNAVPPFFMTKLLPHIAAGGGEGVPARITSEILASSRKLPNMVRRFTDRKSDSTRSKPGYGGGTYWPAGWGEPIPADAVTANGHRLADAPLRYRRRDEWRVQRDTFTNQDVVKIYAQHLAEVSTGEPLSAPLVKKGKVDAIDRAVLRLLALLSARDGAVELGVSVRHLRARLALLHGKLVESAVRGLVAMVASDDDKFLIGDPGGIRTRASLDFGDGGGTSKVPHLVITPERNVRAVSFAEIPMDIRT